MAGLTDQGLVIKRLTEVISSLKTEAVPIFQDLLTDPNDSVDTSDSSTIGRLIGLISPSLSDLWEATQEVYSAFDPNSATGIALDNLVALGGIVRKENTFSTCSMLFSGSNGTLIPGGSVVSSQTTGNRFDVAASVALSPTLASGISFSVATVADNTAYTITYSKGTVLTTYTISYTSGTGATAASILSGLLTEINTNHSSYFNASITGATLNLLNDDIFQTLTFSNSANLTIIQITKVGEVRAEVSGALTQEVGTITTIETPVLGWTSVTNPVATTPGESRETDAELRERFRLTKYEQASNILEAIYSALTSVDGVEQVVVYENDTDVVDGYGIPGHSFMPIILGGLASQIGNAIWQNKPVGILSYGNSSVVIYDSQGFPHTIGFERPNPVPIYISIDLTTNTLYPENGDNLMKEALLSYFAANFGIGDDIIYSRLYTPINSIPGHQVNSLTIGISPSPTGTTNIDIPFNGIYSLSTENIIITAA